jgi:hypothetical protein
MIPVVPTSINFGANLTTGSCIAINRTITQAPRDELVGMRSVNENQEKNCDRNTAKRLTYGHGSLVSSPYNL